MPKGRVKDNRQESYPQQIVYRGPEMHNWHIGTGKAERQKLSPTEPTLEMLTEELEQPLTISLKCLLVLNKEYKKVRREGIHPRENLSVEGSSWQCPGQTDF